MEQHLHTEPAPASAAHSGAPRAERLLRLPQVLEATGRCRTVTLQEVSAGRFPRPIKIGRVALWPESEVQGWITARIREARRPKPAGGA